MIRESQEWSIVMHSQLNLIFIKICSSMIWDQLTSLLMSSIHLKKENIKKKKKEQFMNIIGYKYITFQLLVQLYGLMLRGRIVFSQLPKTYNQNIISKFKSNSKEQCYASQVYPPTCYAAMLFKITLPQLTQDQLGSRYVAHSSSSCLGRVGSVM